MKNFITFFLTLFVASSVWAYDFKVDGIYYSNVSSSVSGNEAWVTFKDEYYNSYSGSVTIPSYVWYQNVRYSVTYIRESAFENCRGLTSVTIPESVTHIEERAFYGCTGLTSITIPNSVTYIGKKAFEGVDLIIYSGNATGAPWGANKICRAFDDNFIYEDAEKTSIYKYIGNGNDVIIPNSVTKIGEHAFDGCSSPTSVTIPESMTSIGKMAFSGFTGLTSITIPESVTTISWHAFDGCRNLTSITIPKSVTVIQQSTFKNCTSLASITIPENVTYISNYAFEGCTSLTSVTIPENVTKIGDFAFCGCTSLTSVTILENVTMIGGAAFYQCSRLTSVTCLATTPPMIGDDCTFGCEHSMTLYVPCESKDLYRNAKYNSSGKTITRWITVKGISCSVSASANDNSLGTVEGAGEFADGDITTLVATPTSGSVFTQWSDGNTDNPRPITVDSNYDLEAIFKAIYTVSLSSNDNSLGLVDGAGEYIDGDTAILTATPASGKAFSQWNDGNTDNPRTIIVESDSNLVAIFKAIYTIKVSANNNSFGSIQGNGKFEEGTTVSISAWPKSGYKFTKWDDGNTDNPRSIIVSADQKYQAIFDKIPTAISEVENGTTITIVNNQILVNGEAPAFVVTISGKKIANQNLKAGVYFVVVDGETVKVVK
ncbi:MAG: leucine-rich repeat domain-containing protein [Bacteroidales bacterium]|nr:leucine-rich repeat domain-containing protein [Bacteroidales bacterium]